MESGSTEAQETTYVTPEDSIRPFTRIFPDENGVYKTKPIHAEDGSFVFTAIPKPKDKVATPEDNFENPYTVTAEFTFKSPMTKEQIRELGERLNLTTFFIKGTTTYAKPRLIEETKTGHVKKLVYDKWYAVPGKRLVPQEKDEPELEKEIEEPRQLHPEAKISTNPLIEDEGNLTFLEFYFNNRLKGGLD